MDAKDNGARGFFVSFFPTHRSGKQCPQNAATPEKMKRLNSANLLRWTVLLLNYLWKASSLNVRTCEGYPGQGDVYHTGFHCPRLSDSHEHMYCCYTGNNSLKYCCKQDEFETLMKVNLSEKIATYIYKSPLPLLGIGFYGLVILSLMIVDFLYYYKLNKKAFCSMLSHTWIVKHLVLPIFHRNPNKGVEPWNKGVADRMAADGRQGGHKPLDGRV
ncbi:protein shisa-like-1a [Rana temporaria]|uniref:protein shisa-like-1a n=1 Tax=Rana temporaria TaxID=8407 RepID=UPI001AAD977F|nr:protein shisa-like-1a [Rana temporaria]